MLTITSTTPKDIMSSSKRTSKLKITSLMRKTCMFIIIKGLVTFAKHPLHVQ
jgi:hypothetical protein